MDCRVCGDEYEAPERRPRVLPCGHTVCHRCIILIIEDRQKLCPICRAPHRASCVHKFPLNYDLENVAHLMELAKTSRLYSVAETDGRWQTGQVLWKGGRLSILLNYENDEDQIENKADDETSHSSNLQDFRLPMLLMEERLPERVFRMLSIDKGLLGCRRCLKLFSKKRRPCVLPCGDSVCNLCQQNVTNALENNKKSKINTAQINYSLEDLTCQLEVVRDKLPWYNELYIIRESSSHFEAALVGVSSARRLSHRRRWYFLHTLQDIHYKTSRHTLQEVMPPKDALTVHVSEDVLPSHLLWHVHLTCAALGRGTSISEVNTNTRLVQRPPPSTNSFMRRVLTSCVAFTTPALRTRNREELTRVD